MKINPKLDIEEYFKWLPKSMYYLTDLTNEL